MPLKVEEVPIKTIAPHEENARLHSEENLDAIKRSLKQFGQRKPVVVWKNKVIAGCGTWSALCAMGAKTISICRADHLSETDAKMYSIADNRTSDLSEFDWTKLQSQLGDFQREDKDLKVLGFQEFELQSMLSGNPEGVDDSMMPDKLAPPEEEALQQCLGRFILVYESEEEKAALLRFLGVDGAKVVYRTGDVVKQTLHGTPVKKAMPARRV